MNDEIDSAAELIERAQLRDVVILRAAADRRRRCDSVEPAAPPEELHAPDSTDDFAAIQLGTRLTDTELVVTLEVQTCNAHAGFQVDAEAVFTLSAPVALGKEAIVQDFTETTGATTVFPYIRAAVASLAAQVSVPASPLPLLPATGMELLSEGEAPTPAVPDGVFAAGTYSRRAEDGTEEKLGEYFIDAETGSLIRFGADPGPDVEEMLNIIAESTPYGPWMRIASADEEEWQGMIHEHGLDEAIALAESIRPTEGDEAADGALARIKAAAWDISLGEAVVALNAAMKTLGEAVSAAAENGGEPAQPDPAATTPLLDAAAEVMARWAEYRDL